MKQVAIIGGETHLSEITHLHGTAVNIVGTCMKEENRATALPDLQAPNFSTQEELLAKMKPEILAIANENDMKFAAIKAGLEAGCDVIVDKPLCLTDGEQDELEALLASRPGRRLLNLLTLRGEPVWMALRDQVLSGRVGDPAFVHVRMAVRLKRSQRPPWFLDVRRSGGLFLDLLIHGLDQVEWLTGRQITALTANMGNLSDPSDAYLRDHAAVYCELDNGGSAIVEGQRMLPDTVGQDYRVLAVGTKGYADMVMSPPSLRVTDPVAAESPVEDLPERISVVQDWLSGGGVVPQEASLRANRLALLAIASSEGRVRMEANQ